MSRKRKVKNNQAQPLKTHEKLRNDLAECLGRNPITGQWGDTGTNALSSADTLFQNNRWYLVSNMRQLLSEIYVEHGLVQTIVDVPVDDGMRGGVIIKSKQLSPDQIEELVKEMERSDVLHSGIGQAIKWNRLFGGAAVLIMTDQDPSTELDVDAIREDSPLQFRAVDMWELFWDRQNADGEFTTDIERAEDFEHFNYYGKRVHKSRVLKMKGITAPSFIRPRLRGWGLSVVETLVRSINQYLKANSLIFEVLDEFKIDVYKVFDLANTLMTPTGQEQLTRRFQIANQQKNYNNAITMDSQDDYIQKELSFAGIADTMTGIRMQVASDMRMPLTKIFGISAAGFSSGEDDIENYNAMVESQVRSKAKYDILRVIELMAQKLFGFIPDDLQIEFKPLRVLSSEQEENVKDSRFNRLMTALQAGAIDKQAFNDAVNKDNLLGVQISGTEMLKIESGDDGDGEPAPKKPPKAKKSQIGAPEPKKAKNSLDMSEDVPQIATIGITSGGEILTGQRRDNMLWVNPGGHLNPGESALAGVIREAYEEAGVILSPDQVTHVSSRIVKSARTGKDFALHVFTADIAKCATTTVNDPDNEVSEWKWVPLHESTPELAGSARHAATDNVLEHLFRRSQENVAAR